MEIVEQKVVVFWFFNLKYRITKRMEKATVPCVVLWVCLNFHLLFSLLLSITTIR